MKYKWSTKNGKLQRNFSISCLCSPSTPPASLSHLLEVDPMVNSHHSTNWSLTTHTKPYYFSALSFPLKHWRATRAASGDDTHWASMSTSMQTCCHRCRAASRDRTWCGGQPWDEDIQFWVTCDLLVSKHSKWTFLALLYFIIFFINSAILFLSYDSDCSPSD